MEDFEKYYTILELNPGATKEEIIRSYRDLIKVWHPDRFQNDTRLLEKANRKLQEINHAYQKLKSVNYIPPLKLFNFDKFMWILKL